MSHSNGIFHRVRGTLGSLLVLSCNAGILFAFMIAEFVGYFAQLRIHMTVAIVYLVVFNFFPESPEYFMKLKSPEVENIYTLRLGIRLETLVNN